MKQTLLLILTLFLFYNAYSQWEQTNGPFGGGLIFSIKQDNTGNLFCGTAWAGIYKSTDNGENWEAANNGLTSMNHPLIGIDADGVIYTSDSGMARSFDSGNNWESCNNGIENISISDIATGADGFVYIGTTDGTNGMGGVYVSDNQGDSWSFCDISAGTYIEQIILTTGPSGDVIAAGMGFMKRSADHGLTWSDLPFPSYSQVSALKIDNNGIIYAGTKYSGPDGGLLKSTDNGLTWSILIPEVDFNSIETSDSNVLFAGANGIVYRSSDEGITWDTLKNGLPAGNFPIFSLLSLDESSLLAGSMGVFSSLDNGNNWMPSNTGLIISSISFMSADAAGNVYAISDKVWLSNDNGDNWTDITDTILADALIKILAEPSGDIYLAANYQNSGKLLKSSDNGENWALIFNIQYPHIIKDFCLNNQGDIFIATSYDGLYRSTDDGQNWERVGFEWTGLSTVTANNSGTLLVSEESGSYIVHRSVDNGDTWQISYSMLTYEPVELTATDSDGTFYISAYNQLLKSEDEGISWSDISSFTGGNEIRALAVDVFDTVHASVTWSGLFLSPDKGETWVSNNQGLPDDSFVTSLAATTTGYMYAGYHGRGVWRSGQGDATNVNYVDVNSLNFYPNPARSKVSVVFPAYNPKEVTILNIYDLRGSLKQSIQLSASNTIIDISNLSSGMYISTLNGNQGKKLIIN